MSREIKFRAWDEGNKVMHTDVEFIKSGDDGNDWICISSNERQYMVVGHKLIFDNPYCRPQIHLMQFTGLKDKNGKEIYEGDIVNIYFYGISVIVWNENICAFQYAYHAIGKGTSVGGRMTNTLYDHDGIKKYEVVGNIYEHPHLLNSEQDPEECDATDDDSKENAGPKLETKKREP